MDRAALAKPVDKGRTEPVHSFLADYWLGVFSLFANSVPRTPPKLLELCYWPIIGPWVEHKAGNGNMSVAINRCHRLRHLCITKKPSTI